jgi:hypothetical protein
MSRLYVVTHVESGAKRLVEAANPSQAMRHVAGKTFDVKAAKPQDVAAVMAGGVTVEQAKVDE